MVRAGGIFHDVSAWFFTLTPKISFSLASHIFETQWNGAHVIGWTNRPLFLIPDPTLIARWADLCAELAAAQTNSVISRISGRGY
jgi:hypothetical protein